MDLEAAEAYAVQWAEDWNSHDLERILSHYTEDVAWASPTIVRVMNDPSGELHGKDALRAYFSLAMERMNDLHFVVEHVRAGVNSIVIGYRNERGIPVSEVLTIAPRRLRRPVSGHAEEPPDRWSGGSSSKVVRRRPTLPQGPPCSTIGAMRLSFRVRDVTGRFPHAMTTETL